MPTRRCSGVGDLKIIRLEINRFVDSLKSRKFDLKRVLFGLEATGIYSQRLLGSLQQLQLAACLLNPAQVKYFGISKLRRSKNDSCDALLIAHYLLERRPAATKPLSTAEAQLKELVVARESLCSDLVRQKNRREKHRLLSDKLPAIVLQQGLERIKQFKLWINQLDHQIAQLIDSDPVLKTRCQLLCSIPGIALCSAAKILSQLAGKDFESAHQLVLYCGLNPRQNQSGQSNRSSPISKVGNALLRKALFMPAAVASRHCAPIKLWSQLLQRRRPDLSKLSIRTALMHKLLRIIFAVLHKQTPFDPQLIAVSNFP